jgi:hypothetical protein
VESAAEHLGERHLGLDAAEAVALGGAHDDAAALHERADDAALKLARALDAHLHDRLEDLRAGLGVGLAPGAAGGLLEGDVRRVDGVERAVVDG